MKPNPVRLTSNVKVAIAEVSLVALTPDDGDDDLFERQWNITYCPVLPKNVPKRGGEVHEEGGWYSKDGWVS